MSKNASDPKTSANTVASRTAQSRRSSASACSGRSPIIPSRMNRCHPAAIRAIVVAHQGRRAQCTGQSDALSTTRRTQPPIVVPAHTAPHEGRKRGHAQNID